MAPPRRQIRPLSADAPGTAEPTPRYHATLPAAPLWRRLAALVYDGLLLLALAFAYAALILAVEVQLFGASEAPVRHWSGIAGLWAALFDLGLWAWLSLYYLWCWRRSGQTLGMKTWRLRLQQPDGSPPTPRQAWLRCLLAPLALASVIGYLWCLWSRTGDCLHDRWTGTRVVVLPRQR
jgi:Predicted membrane protein/domain